MLRPAAKSLLTAFQIAHSIVFMEQNNKKIKRKILVATLVVLILILFANRNHIRRANVSEDVGFGGNSVYTANPSSSVSTGTSSSIEGNSHGTTKSPEDLIPLGNEDFAKKFTLPSVELPASRLTLKQVEKIRESAKKGLQQAYAAQQDFYMKYGRFTTDLVAIGFYPSSPEIGYKMGFLKAAELHPQKTTNYNSKEDPRRMNLDIYLTDKVEEEFDGFYYSLAAKDINLNRYQNLCQNGCSAGVQGFEMLLAIPFDEDHIDVWIINNKNELLHSQDGFIENEK